MIADLTFQAGVDRNMRMKVKACETEVKGKTKRLRLEHAVAFHCLVILERPNTKQQLHEFLSTFASPSQALADTVFVPFVISSTFFSPSSACLAFNALKLRSIAALVNSAPVTFGYFFSGP